MIEHFKGRIPILGVCLGHQSIAAMHGMDVHVHEVMMHGKTSDIHHEDAGVFAGLSRPSRPRGTTRSSWSGPTSSATLRSRSPPGPTPMRSWGLRWTEAPEHAPLEGVQFHPESFPDVEGPKLLANFVGV